MTNKMRGGRKRERITTVRLEVQYMAQRHKGSMAVAISGPARCSQYLNQIPTGIFLFDFLFPYRNSWLSTVVSFVVIILPINATNNKRSFTLLKSVIKLYAIAR